MTFFKFHTPNGSKTYNLILHLVLIKMSFELELIQKDVSFDSETYRLCLPMAFCFKFLVSFLQYIF